jgi:uncharacterized protein
MEELAPEAIRVLGCLIEKQHTTPDQYPLTMNALVVACNQTTNRFPVVGYDVPTVDAALGLLREQKLVRVLLAAGRQATKYRHVVDEAWGLTPAECAVLAVLFLRGPQTVNELRTRTERYQGIDELGGIEPTLERLATRYAEPYVTRLGRHLGQREERWAHLLGGEVDDTPMPTPAPARTSNIDQLRVEVAELRAEVAELRRRLEGGDGPAG